jgi:hypothetical protein
MSDTALSYSIFANDKTAPGLRSAGAGMEKFGGAAKKILGGLAVGAAIGGAVGFAKGLIADARESARVGRMTEAVVKSTGGAAKISADQVGKLATAISNKTGADDEAIQSGQNLLLTFTNIKNQAGKGNDVFNQASQAITDMTAALNNGDVSAEKIKGSSVMLGKALNDPVKGITALSRAGVSFTAGQKEQITSMVKAGDTMGAQKIILGELKKEFGGAAAAATDPAQKAGVAWGNLREQLGGYLLPVIGKVATFLSAKVIPAVSKFFDNVAHGGGTFASFRSGLAQVGTFIQGTVLPLIQRFGNWFTSVGWPAIKRFSAAFWQDLQPALKQIATSFQTQLRPALESAIGKFREAWPTIKRVLTILGEIAGFIMTRVVPVLIQFYAKYLANMIRFMSEVFSVTWKVIGVLIDIGAKLGKAGAAFGRFVSDVVDKVKSLPGKVTGAVGNTLTLLEQKGKDLVQGMINGIVAGSGWLYDKIKEYLVDKPVQYITHPWEIFSPSRLTRRFGLFIAQGMALGIEDGAPTVADKVRNMVDKAKTALDEAKDLARSIREAFQEMANPTSFSAPTEPGQGPGNILDWLKQQAAASKQFVSGMKKLKKMGLNATTLEQLRDAGPGSLDTVNQLLGSDIGQVNSLVGQIDQAGHSFGNSEAKSKFGVNPEKKVTVVIDVQGGDADLKKMIKKMVRVDGGGDVQVAFGKG